MPGLAFAPQILWRPSRRGLVLAGADEDALVLDHPSAAQLPEFLGDSPEPDQLAERLGPPNAHALVAELVDAGVLTTDPDIRPSPTTDRRAWRWTRSGLELDTIERPAAWLNRYLVPLVRSLPGRLTLATVVIAGAVALLAGRPAAPAVSTHPVAEALAGLAILLALSAAHELAHAVALVHYGRRPRRAGFGFYWGGISFYVDSAEALTLPRRARVVQALVGLGVDIVACAVLALLAHVSSSTFVVALCWRLAVVALIDIAINLAPILEVDGHWALSDYLDEPELAYRARTAFGNLLRGRRTSPALAAYGALSVIGGITLLAGGTYLWWLAGADLLTALFTSNIVGVVVGVVLVGPLVISMLLSATGMLVDAVLGSSDPAKD